MWWSNGCDVVSNGDEKNPGNDVAGYVCGSPCERPIDDVTWHVHGFPEAAPQTLLLLLLLCVLLLFTWSNQGRCILGWCEIVVVPGWCKLDVLPATGDVDNVGDDSIVVTGDVCKGLTGGLCNGVVFIVLIVCKTSNLGWSGLGVENGVKADVVDDWSPGSPILGYGYAAGFGKAYGYVAAAAAR